MRTSWLGRLVGVVLLADLVWLVLLIVGGGSLQEVLTAVSAFVIIVGVYVAVVGFDRSGGL